MIPSATGKFPLKSPAFFCALILALPALLQAQQVRDTLDRVDGDNPTLRYGFYTDPSGQVQGGRFYFIDDGTSLRVSLVPYGRTAVELPVQAYDRDTGKLELGWEGLPERHCRLVRHGDDLFLGNCIEGENVMPMAIRLASRYDVEWMGTYFSVSRTDVDIVQKAIDLLGGQQGRNPADDRNCDDDTTAGRFSIFCALYAASVEVAGVYRHRRPAIQAVRDELWNRFPGDYQHLLRDINNRADIQDQALIEAFDAARRKLLLELPVSER